MLSFRKIVFLVLALLAATSFATQATINTEPSLTIVLPVNASTTPKTALSIDIPAKFSALTPVESFFKSKTALLQFVPNGETEKVWTRMITLEKKAGRKISAKNSIANMMAFLQKNTEDLQILENKVTQTDAYQEARLGVSYKFKQHHEMIYFVFYSGPDDLSSIQYAVVMKANQSIPATFKEIKSAVKQISSLS